MSDGWTADLCFSIIGSSVLYELEWFEFIRFLCSDIFVSVMYEFEFFVLNGWDSVKLFSFILLL